MKVNFLLAEEVRAELNNKFTIIGMYPGDVVVLLKTGRPAEIPVDTPIALERLTILATVIEAPDGEHVFKGKMVAPSGELVQPESMLGSAATRVGFSHTVVIEMKPFIVKELGVYNFQFFVDDSVFTYSFEIREEQ